MPILLQGSNCKLAAQSRFMHLLLFITEPFLQTHKAPHGPIILVFSSTNYASLPHFMAVSKVLYLNLTDGATTTSALPFAGLTLQDVMPDRSLLSLLTIWTLWRKSVHIHQRKQTNMTGQKKVILAKETKRAALTKSETWTQKRFHSNLQTGRMILC